MSIPWLALARAEIGAKEVPGPESSAAVLGYFADAAHPEIRGDEVPWCAGFVGAMLRRAGAKPSGSLAARSYERWGRPLPGPVLGCVGVKRRAGAGWTGHVGFVVGANAAQIVLLGGNQGDAVSLAAFRRADFTAFRWPSEFPLPRDAALPQSVAGARTGLAEV